MDQTLAGLAALDYRPASPVTLAPSTPLTLITLAGAAGPEYWIVFNDFKAITTYNISRHYATAVYQLSELIAGRGGDAG